MFERIANLEQASEFRGRLLANKDFAFKGAGQDSEVFWSPYK